MAQATLNGYIVDDGTLGCEARFQYGLTPALGSFTAWLPGPYYTGDNFSVTLYGLPGNTIYYYRAECRSAIGAGVAGSTLSFVTTTPSFARVAILAPEEITERSALLKGLVVDDAGHGGNVRFEWGLTTSYGNMTAWQSGFQTGDEFESRILSLSPGVSYHARAVFQSGRTPTYSSDLSFKTLALTGSMVLVDGSMLNLFLNEE